MDDVEVSVKRAVAAAAGGKTMKSTKKATGKKSGKKNRQRRDTVAEKVYALKDILRRKGTQYQVLWSDNSKTWEPKRNVVHLLKCNNFSFQKTKK